MTLTTHTAADPVSKHARTEYNRFDRVAGRMRACYVDAEAFSGTFEQFLADQKAVYESDDYKKLTSYYQGKIAGISDTWWGLLYGCLGQNKPLLMHVLIGRDGRIFVEGNDSWLQESTEYKSTMTSRHIWRRPHAEKGILRFWA